MKTKTNFKKLAEDLAVQLNEMTTSRDCAAKAHHDTVETLRIERLKFTAQIQELNDKASYTTRILKDAKERAENAVVRTHATGEAAFLLLLGVDRSIERLK